MADIDIQSGIISAVRIEQENGSPVARVDIQSYRDLSIIQNIKIDTPLHAQYIPVVGQNVTFWRIGNYFTRILAVHSEGTRQFDAPIQPGAILIEGSRPQEPFGGGFLHLDTEGNAMLSDETLSNVIKLLSSIGVLITADSLSINVKGVGQINITPKNDKLGTEDRIEFLKLDGEIDAENPVTKIVMTKEKIVVDGAEVEIGREDDSIKGGTVVSQSGVTGPYSFDLFTGRPIPQSGTVKSTIFPET